MHIELLENHYMDWENISAEPIHGVTGSAMSKSMDCENIRIRKLLFTANYEADHGCTKGHIIHVLSGEHNIAFQNGRITKQV